MLDIQNHAQIGIVAADGIFELWQIRCGHFWMRPCRKGEEMEGGLMVSERAAALEAHVAQLTEQLREIVNRLVAAEARIDTLQRDLQEVRRCGKSTPPDPMP